MKSELKEMIEIASRNCDTIFRESGEILPMWHAVNADGQHELYATPLFDNMKDATAEGVRLLFAERHIVRAVFMTEAWTCAPDDGERAMEWKRQGRSMETFPERIEVVMFMAQDNNGEAITANRKIIRNKGRPKLGPLEVWSEGIVAGRFTDMLPRKGATH